MPRPFLSHFALMAALCASSVAMPLWQPIIDYTTTFSSDSPDAAPIINPFENFTHFASDFGWMGPGEGRIDAKGSIIRVRPEGEWTGAWHSLAGLASQPDRLLDPRNLIGLACPPAARCSIRGLGVNASGHGALRLELVDVAQKVVWSAKMQLDSETTVTAGFPISPEITEKMKFMNWIAEPGAAFQISSIGFTVERPEMSLEEWAFQTSLGKLRRCHDPASGLTRDRGHLPAGAYDSIASSGMEALASAVGAAEGVLPREQVIAEVTKTITTIRSLPTAFGFFPHFVYRDEAGNLTIHPSTEYSTIDTAIAIHSLLLATQILDLPDLTAQVTAMIARMDFDATTDPEGWISHGFLDDGKTALQSSWRDWGGETALVLCLEALVPDRSPRGKMIPSGEIYRGVGFIAELQSLFYPDFDRSEPDLLTGISWPESRKRVLDRQIAYPRENWPQSAAQRHGIFGLSAGESGMPGAGYTANGTEVMGVRWLHPHYMLMGLALSGGDRYPEGLRALDSAGFLLPLGLPENSEAGLKLRNPMQGSLNASFEALAAYHGWRKRASPKNVIDTASLASPLLRTAASRFYHQPVAIGQ